MQQLLSVASLLFSFHHASDTKEYGISTILMMNIANLYLQKQAIVVRPTNGKGFSTRSQKPGRSERKATRRTLSESRVR
jgi:hypothetical protein